MLCKLKCVLLNIHKKVQTPYIVTSFGFSWEMKNLCQRPSMTVALILTSSLQARSDTLQRSWRYQNQLCGTSNRLQVTPQAAQIKMMRYQSNRPPTRQTQEKSLQTQDHRVTSNQQVSNKLHHTKEGLILNKLIQAKIDVLNVVTLSMLKDSNVKLRSTSASLVTSMNILPA